MAYTALEKMRIYNRERFRKDLGPFQPALHAATGAQDLKSAALRFLHERCEGLLFDTGKEETDPSALLSKYVISWYVPQTHSSMQILTECLLHNKD